MFSLWFVARQKPLAIVSVSKVTSGPSAVVCSNGTSHTGLTSPFVMVQPEHSSQPGQSKHTASKRLLFGPPYFAKTGDDVSVAPVDYYVDKPRSTKVCPNMQPTSFAPPSALPACSSLGERAYTVAGIYCSSILQMKREKIRYDLVRGTRDHAPRLDLSKLSTVV